jgi:hypothetical protein
LLLGRATRCRAAGHGHFCHALHVAMQSGLYHFLLEAGIRRIVSEDSWPLHVQAKPFLLIARTPRIFTAAEATSTGGYTGFSSI